MGELRAVECLVIDHIFCLLRVQKKQIKFVMKNPAFRCKTECSLSEVKNNGLDDNKHEILMPMHLKRKLLNCSCSARDVYMLERSAKASISRCNCI